MRDNILKSVKISPASYVMQSAKTSPLTEMMNKEQLNTFKEKYCEMIVDGMDMDCLVQMCYELLMDSYQSCTEEEITEEILDLYDEEMLEDLMP
jgi:DNA-binding protein YbaB